LSAVPSLSSAITPIGGLFFMALGWFAMQLRPPA